MDIIWTAVIFVLGMLWGNLLGDHCTARDIASTGESKMFGGPVITGQIKTKEKGNDYAKL